MKGLISATVILFLDV